SSWQLCFINRMNADYEYAIENRRDLLLAFLPADALWACAHPAHRRPLINIARSLTHIDPAASFGAVPTHHAPVFRSPPAALRPGKKCAGHNTAVCELPGPLRALLLLTETKNVKRVNETIVGATPPE